MEDGRRRVEVKPEELPDLDEATQGALDKDLKEGVLASEVETLLGHWSVRYLASRSAFSVFNHTYHWVRKMRGRGRTPGSRPQPGPHPEVRKRLPQGEVPRADLGQEREGALSRSPPDEVTPMPPPASRPRTGRTHAGRL